MEPLLFIPSSPVHGTSADTMPPKLLQQKAQTLVIHPKYCSIFYLTWVLSTL